ncbi:hypothetical protein WMF39_48355 [Sorangium sp. So ce1504]|uniref:hypothetical protein n=1 Tax=Sorangium sp. So ce1504 TaxID=3133337 RepID=UPI003F623C6F
MSTQCQRLISDSMPPDVSRYIAPHHALGDDRGASRVWQRTMAAHTAMLDELRDHVDPAYLRGFARLDLDPLRVPSIQEISRRVEEIGWTATCVDGYVPSRVYATLLARRVFPIATFMRSEHHIDHAPAPDFVHDVLGHLPMLFCAAYRTYLQRLAQMMIVAGGNDYDRWLYEANRHMSTLMSQSASPEEIALAEASARRAGMAASANPSEQSELNRIFLWSVEFGLLGTFDEFRLFGAALLSSHREGRLACRGDAQIRPYSMDVIGYDIEFSSLQSMYFVASDYDVFHEVLTGYESRMASRRSVERL